MLRDARDAWDVSSGLGAVPLLCLDVSGSRGCASTSSLPSVTSPHALKPLEGGSTLAPTPPPASSSAGGASSTATAPATAATTVPVVNVEPLPSTTDSVKASSLSSLTSLHGAPVAEERSSAPVCRVLSPLFSVPCHGADTLSDRSHPLNVRGPDETESVFTEKPTKAADMNASIPLLSAAPPRIAPADSHPVSFSFSASLLSGTDVPAGVMRSSPPEAPGTSTASNASARAHRLVPVVQAPALPSSSFEAVVPLLRPDGAATAATAARPCRQQSTPILSANPKPPLEHGPSLPGGMAWSTSAEGTAPLLPPPILLCPTARRTAGVPGHGFALQNNFIPTMEDTERGTPSSLSSDSNASSVNSDSSAALPSLRAQGTPELKGITPMPPSSHGNAVTQSITMPPVVAKQRAHRSRTVPSSPPSTLLSPTTFHLTLSSLTFKAPNTSMNDTSAPTCTISATPTKSIESFAAVGTTTMSTAMTSTSTRNTSTHVGSAALPVSASLQGATTSVSTSSANTEVAAAALAESSTRVVELCVGKRQPMLPGGNGPSKAHNSATEMSSREMGDDSNPVSSRDAPAPATALTNSPRQMAPSEPAKSDRNCSRSGSDDTDSPESGSSVGSGSDTRLDRLSRVVEVSWRGQVAKGHALSRRGADTAATAAATTLSALLRAPAVNLFHASLASGNSTTSEPACYFSASHTTTVASSSASLTDVSDGNAASSSLSLTSQRLPGAGAATTRLSSLFAETPLVAGHVPGRTVQAPVVQSCVDVPSFLRDGRADAGKACDSTAKTTPLRAEEPAAWATGAEEVEDAPAQRRSLESVTSTSRSWHSTIDYGSSPNSSIPANEEVAASSHLAKHRRIMPGSHSGGYAGALVGSEAPLLTVHMLHAARGAGAKLDSSFAAHTATPAPTSRSPPPSSSSASSMQSDTFCQLRTRSHARVEEQTDEATGFTWSTTFIEVEELPSGVQRVAPMLAGVTSTATSLDSVVLVESRRAAEQKAPRTWPGGEGCPRPLRSLPRVLAVEHAVEPTNPLADRAMEAEGEKGEKDEVDGEVVAEMQVAAVQNRFSQLANSASTRSSGGTVRSVFEKRRTTASEASPLCPDEYEDNDGDGDGDGDDDDDAPCAVPGSVTTERQPGWTAVLSPASSTSPMVATAAVDNTFMMPAVAAAPLVHAALGRAAREARCAVRILDVRALAAVPTVRVTVAGLPSNSCVSNSSGRHSDMASSVPPPAAGTTTAAPPSPLSSTPVAITTPALTPPRADAALLCQTSDPPLDKQSAFQPVSAVKSNLEKPLSDKQPRSTSTPVSKAEGFNARARPTSTSTPRSPLTDGGAGATSPPSAEWHLANHYPAPLHIKDVVLSSEDDGGATDVLDSVVHTARNKRWADGQSCYDSQFDMLSSHNTYEASWDATWGGGSATSQPLLHGGTPLTSPSMSPLWSASGCTPLDVDGEGEGEFSAFHRPMPALPSSHTSMPTFGTSGSGTPLVEPLDARDISESLTASTEILPATSSTSGGSSSQLSAADMLARRTNIVVVACPVPSSSGGLAGSHSSLLSADLHGRRSSPCDSPLDPESSVSASFIIGGLPESPSPTQAARRHSHAESHRGGSSGASPTTLGPVFGTSPSVVDPVPRHSPFSIEALSSASSVAGSNATLGGKFPPPKCTATTPVSRPGLPSVEVVSDAGAGGRDDPLSMEGMNCCTGD